MGDYIGQSPGTIPLALINAPNGIAGLDATAKLLQAAFRQVKAVTFTRDTALASGNQAVVGVGFKPRAIFVFGTITPGSAVGQASLGMASDGAPIAQSTLACASNIAANSWVVQNNSVAQFSEGAAIHYTGALASFDADGFTIAWTKTGAKTGVVTLQAFCLF